MKIVSLILAGGSSERFWPLSRISKPKQCLRILSNKTLIEETYLRLKNFGEFAIVANSDLCNIFKSILPSNVLYIEEPFKRNTAPAIALACKKIIDTFGECIIFVETVDHFYESVEIYINTIKKACDYAQNHDQIILIGIKPTNPHIGYGYIQNDGLIKEDFYKIKSFKEKPNLEMAQKYLLDPSYSWNSGMLVAKSSIILNEFKNHLPNIYECIINSKNDYDEKKTFEDKFTEIEKISMDHGILEKSSNIVVLKTNMHWDDIGEFNAIPRIKKISDSKNYFENEVISLNSNKNIVLSKKLVALIDIDDLIVVDTKDALLICKRDQTHKIKELLKSLDEKYH